MRDLISHTYWTLNTKMVVNHIIMFLQNNLFHSHNRTQNAHATIYDKSNKCNDQHIYIC